MSRFEPKSEVLKQFLVGNTFYLNGILFRICKRSRKGLEIRPVYGAPRQVPSKNGKVDLSLPLPGGMCPLCGGVVRSWGHKEKEAENG